MSRPAPRREPAKHRLTAAEFHRMAEAGVLRKHDRVELIDGELIDMAPVDSQHASVVARLNAWLALAGGGRFIVFPQSRVALSEHSEPQPDLIVLRSRDDYYRDALPNAQDVLLVIEVANATLKHYRTIKVPLYARGGIAEVWLVHRRGAALEVFRAPDAEGYGLVARIGRGQRIAPLAFPELGLQLNELFR